jgi:hypothetical protein
MIPVPACFPGPMDQQSKGAQYSQYSREVLSVSYVRRLLTSGLPQEVLVQFMVMDSASSSVSSSSFWRPRLPTSSLVHQ